MAPIGFIDPSLPSFALWTTLSSSLVPRDWHDYYDGSDSLPLSRGSRSHVPYGMNVLDRFRWPVRVLDLSL